MSDLLVTGATIPTVIRQRIGTTGGCGLTLELDEAQRKLVKCNVANTSERWMVMELLNPDGSLKARYVAAPGQTLAQGLAESEQIPYTVETVARSGKEMLNFPHRIYYSKTNPIVVANEYLTDFAADQNPLSEGGVWARNQANFCTNARALGGVALGTQVADITDDSYAILQNAAINQSWGANYELECVVFRHPSLNVAASHEIELNVRAADGPDFYRCYEILFSHSGQIECFRWGGPFDTFTTLAGSASGFGTINDGDVCRVRIVGDIITAFHNGIQRATFDIAGAGAPKFDDGNPAIAFFTRPQQGGNNSHFGMKSVRVTKL